MITEKSTTAQNIIDRISASADKVGYLPDTTLVKALQMLEQQGIPSNRHEDYKYCNLDAILKKEFKNLNQSFLPVHHINEFRMKDAITLVVVNGTFSAALSDKMVIRGLHLQTFSELDESAKNKIATLANVDSDAFVALNTAFCSNGFYLRVEKGAAIPMPVHVIYINTADGEALVNTRNFIELEEGAELQLIEEQVQIGSGKIFSNFLSEKLVAKNARLQSCLFQNESGRSYSVNTNQVQMARDSYYENTTVTLNGQVVRNNHQVVLAGENGVSHLNGLFLAGGTQLVDNHTLMDHQVPHCESNELYKGIINDRSTGVFNGKIFVRKDAQKTNAYQSSKNILLSDEATINTKPQLEIYANDVKCSHGTSTGKIDENALFYLNARGIGKDSAKKMLLSSFAQEVILKIESEELRDKISHLFENRI